MYKIISNRWSNKHNDYYKVEECLFNDKEYTNLYVDILKKIYTRNSYEITNYKPKSKMFKDISKTYKGIEFIVDFIESNDEIIVLSPHLVKPIDMLSEITTIKYVKNYNDEIGIDFSHFIKIIVPIIKFINCDNYEDIKNVVRQEAQRILEEEFNDDKQKFYDYFNKLKTKQEG